MTNEPKGRLRGGYTWPQFESEGFWNSEVAYSFSLICGVYKETWSTLAQTNNNNENMNNNNNNNKNNKDTNYAYN